jgi:hypothetical protein
VAEERGPAAMLDPELYEADWNAHWPEMVSSVPVVDTLTNIVQGACTSRG